MGEVRYTLNAKIGVNELTGNLTQKDTVFYDWVNQKELTVLDVVDLLNYYNNKIKEQ